MLNECSRKSGIAISFTSEIVDVLNVYDALTSIFFRVHLFETCPYSEEEKKEFMDEAERLRQDVGGLYTEVVLPGTPLAKKIDSLTWIAVGESLLATYKTMSDNNKPLVKRTLVPKSTWV